MLCPRYQAENLEGRRFCGGRSHFLCARLAPVPVMSRWGVRILAHRRFSDRVEQSLGPTSSGGDP